MPRAPKRPIAEPRTTLWLAVPASALVVLPFLGRRRVRSKAEIAQELFIIDTTVKTRVTDVFQKLKPP